MFDPKKIELIYYLTGDIKEAVAAAFNHGQEKLIPLCDPIGSYLNEVNRFLFAGGVGVDVVGAESGDPRQIYLNKILQTSQLNATLAEIWRHGAITGEMLACPRLSELGHHVIDWYPATEFEPEYEGDRLYEIEIKAIRYKEVEGTDRIEPHRFKKKIYMDRFVDYPLVPLDKEEKFDWDAAATETPHNYRELPAVVIKNRIALNQSRGEGEFNYAAAKIASMAAMLTFDAAENVHFFGAPIFDSPDPADTLKRLQARSRVLQKLGADDGGGHNVLAPPSISSQHLEFMEKLNKIFRDHMGIRSGDDSMAKDLSSLALKLLNATTISKAESKWLNYVEAGLVPLLQLILRMAAVDGILSAVSPLNPDTYQLTAYRKKPYFSLSPTEMLQNAQVAMAWIDMGMDRTQVLHELIFPDLPIEEVEAKLRPNLEDL
jgi:hypothetical protein